MPKSKYRKNDMNARRKAGMTYKKGKGGYGGSEDGTMGWTRSMDHTGPTGTGGGNIRCGSGMMGYCQSTMGKATKTRRSYKPSDLFRK